MISIERHVAERLVLRFRNSPEQYGFRPDPDPDEEGAVVLHQMAFAVSGGYLQIFAHVVMIIAMGEIISLSFIPSKGVHGPLIAVE